MRRRLSSVLGALALVSLLATPVSAAAPVENGWDAIIGASFFDPCTGEVVDNNGKVHNVLKDDGSSHFNVHVEGTGESSGFRYVYNAQDNEQVHIAADGSYTFDQVLNFGIRSQGDSPDQRLTIRLRQVFDSDGNLISERSDFSIACQGS